ncbi:MAG: sigma-70 family RNA polymerase sigma factor [Gemmataceae bacterium]
MPAVSARSSFALPPPADPRSDAVLLALFHAQADEAAFAALVTRHTPLVRAVGGAWLRSAADIDDAAQATFLVLVQRADTIRDPSKLGPWLCRTAGFVARRLRKQLTRTTPLEADPPARTPPSVDDRTEAVAAELARLPEPYRLPVQLHYAAGLSTAEIADKLGWPKGTVLTRLDRARKLLERRLSARGLTIALAGVVGSRSVSAGWVQATARAAVAWRCGESPTAAGASDRSVSLTDGVVRTMTWNKLRLLLAAVMVATGLGGFALGQWGTQKPKPAEADSKVAAKVEDPKPTKADEPKPAAGRRREAVIKVPTGTFVKEIDGGPYGSGRMSWTFEDEKVLGKIEASLAVLGGAEVELVTEAEYSLISNGTIYGVVTGVKVTHLKIPQGLGKEGDQIAALVGLLPLAEPLLNEVLTDLPFSYQFRLVGDRLTILNYRALLAGPNPFGKLGLLAGAGGKGEAAFLAYFQAFGTAIEGTYTAADPDAPEPAKKKPVVRKLGK